jgi:sterol desaturase/sphingolipid hydroxylase (fatty acid hydroxylase superfamily)
MKTQIYSSAHGCNKRQYWLCIFVFCLLLLPLVSAGLLLYAGNRFVFHTLLFFTGWFIWTFIEYMAHRFWMHSTKGFSGPGSDSRHQHHHVHPTDIKITSSNRFMLTLIGIILILLSTWLNDYFTVFTGFYMGFAGYCFMHYFLHQRWAQYVFKNLQRFHLYHHCKYPNRCFGVSVTWWDRFLNTRPPAGASLSQRTIDFFFGTHRRIAQS